MRRAICLRGQNGIRRTDGLPVAALVKLSKRWEHGHPVRQALWLFVIVIPLVLFSGCATASRESWTKEGAGPNVLARDRYACALESRVPYPTPYGASVASGGSCGGFVVTGTARRAQSEANRLFDACMEARGWH